jgi:hypothetical protein
MTPLRSCQGDNRPRSGADRPRASSTLPAPSPRCPLRCRLTAGAVDAARPETKVPAPEPTYRGRRPRCPTRVQVAPSNSPPPRTQRSDLLVDAYLGGSGPFPTTRPAGAAPTRAASSTPPSDPNRTRRRTRNTRVEVGATARPEPLRRLPLRPEPSSSALAQHPSRRRRARTTRAAFVCLPGRYKPPRSARPPDPSRARRPARSTGAGSFVTPGRPEPPSLSLPDDQLGAWMAPGRPARDGSSWATKVLTR